jgi:hypothetical protein
MTRGKPKAKRKPMPKPSRAMVVKRRRILERLRDAMTKAGLDD